MNFQEVKEAKPEIIIRFDDYGVWCNDDWIKIEEQLIKLHEQYNVRITFATIPDSKYPLIRHVLSPQSYPQKVDSIWRNPYPLLKNSTRVELLKESTHKGITEVALHGYYHPKGYSNTSINTEFYNIPYDEQYRKLHNGKFILDSLFETNVTTFIPPHNTYDKLTLDLLQEFGFNCISAKKNSFDAPRDERLNIKYLWYTTANCSEFKKILSGIHYLDEPVKILQLHHTNFTTDGVIDKAKLASYAELLKYIRDNKISNYTFSTYQGAQLKYYDECTESFYYCLMHLTSNKIAVKFCGLCNYVPTLCLMILFMISLSLGLYGIASICLAINPFVISKSLRFGAWTLSFMLALFIGILMLHAFSISLYDLHRIIFSKKLILMICLLSVILPIAVKKNSK